MHLLIHVEVNEKNLLHFQKEILAWASGCFKSLHLFDFDNHSDIYLVDAALKLVKEAEKVAVIIDVEAADMDAGVVIKFLNALLRLKKDQIMVIMVGQHDVLSKMIKPFRILRLDLHINAQKEKLQEFFKE